MQNQAAGVCERTQEAALESGRAGTLHQAGWLPRSLICSFIFS